jgi:glycosyltransferase involved in cell wall biosynthesis
LLSARSRKGTALQTTSPSSTPAIDSQPSASSAPRGLSEETLAIDDASVADFVARHGAPTFAPVTIVIPSYGEAANIESVLSEIPDEILGMRTSALVVVDGRHPSEEEGATARRVEATGHHVAVAPVNRGQGAALRVAYRLAREGGAEYIVSLDADGQYDAAEIPRLLEPIVAGEADFVSGSRRLGSTEHYDAVRNAGVDVYARIISILTRHKITDPANGLRAMRAELTADVPLTEPQYQASELEVGAIMRGWRVTERPNTMRRRHSGKSKKQHNIFYALQFGRVVSKTWLRGLTPEVRRARRARRAGFSANS